MSWRSEERERELVSGPLEIDARGGRNKKSAGDVHAVIS